MAAIEVIVHYDRRATEGQGELDDATGSRNCKFLGASGMNSSP
jgi:hypothetical protein